MISCSVALSNQEMYLKAVSCLKDLEAQRGISPKIRAYFQQGKLYYSYLTGGGFLTCIDTIAYNPAYEACVRRFQQQYDALVYHVIESVIPGTGTILDLLYIGREDPGEEYAYLFEGRYVSCYEVNLDTGAADFSDIPVESVNGILIRLFQI